MIIGPPPKFHGTRDNLWIPPDRTAVVGRDIMLRLTC